jgi:drug/metabolite transporter (DMT)-like permease
MKQIYALLGTIGGVSIVEAFGLFFLRSGGFQNTLIACLFYGAGVAPLLAKSLQYEGIGIVNLLWNIVSTLFGFGIGIYLFNERVHYLQLIGAAFSFLGIGLILMAPKDKS